LGCFIFRMILIRANKRLDDGTDVWVVQDDVAEQTARTEGVNVEEGAKMMKDYRYLI
jgi:hypothetical protein